MNTGESDELDDRKLVEEFLESKSEEVFRKIFRRHSSALYLLAIRLTGGKEADAQDLIQEMWIQACRSFHKFRWKSKLRTWLSGILVNCFRDSSKKRIRKNEIDMPKEIGGRDNNRPSQTLYLEKIIESLPVGYRRVIVLHDIEGYTHEEISRLLGINIGTSKSQLFHARKSVRKSLETRREER